MFAVEPKSLVQVSVRRGQGAGFSQALSGMFGLTVPPPGHAASGQDGARGGAQDGAQGSVQGSAHSSAQVDAPRAAQGRTQGRTQGCALLWLQPDVYLLTGATLAEAAALAPFAALVDQTDGRTCFTLSGPGARKTLAKGSRVDLHPRAFGPGRVAGTTIAHIQCLIHQTSDEPRFDLFVFSSFAQHFSEWLGHG